MTLDLPFDQMAVVGALLDRVAITGVVTLLNNDGVCIVRQNNGC